MRLGRLATAMIALALIGCASVPAQYVRADRQTKKSFDPYLGPLGRGEQVQIADPAEMRDFNNAVQSWEDRLQAAEQQHGIPATQPQ